jgi:hypothetical protein
MANWQRTIKLQPWWGQAQTDEISVQELAGVVADKLEKLAAFGEGFEDIDQERDWLVEAFRDLQSDEAADIPEFDNLMNELYNWSDTSLDGQPLAGRAAINCKKVCWVDTHGL